jgi:Ribosomally synthesized peptide prototyped by Frankia Franean1_4349.
MSQRSVERVIGRLVTDEGFRRRFAAQPETVLQEAMGCGLELTACEVQALSGIDRQSLQRFADAIDPRLQKTEIQGGVH